MFEKFKSLCKQYSHGILFLYAFIYMPWFALVENHVTRHFHIVHMVLDDYIPFVEYFVVPYLFWFIYVSATLVFFFFYSKEDFKKACLFLFTGMTIFLIISTVYPNGAHIRPIVFPRDNIFTDLVKMVYASDTATNLFPSIHVYNSIGIHLALKNSDAFKNRKKFLLASQITCILIILSTMFIKQHSVFDVLTGMGLAFFMWLLVYAPVGVLEKGSTTVSLPKYNK
ncbi:MAG: phosphatase PAP2 family protein [Lachnospiraceae bacterium]|nr:phosphatase PAP2 family protein [Lachnospiraceae bacterium]